MCGICGIIRNDDAAIEPDVLVRMRDSLIHRGPDDAGIWLSKSRNIGFAHRRLSIIDISKAAHQPMSNEDGTVWLTFNGEIYNFLEVRKLLKAKNHQFRSRTDAEVVIHAYEEWGESCLKHFNGMFAFAICDCRKRNNSTLFLARDRVGKKPLYYFHNKEQFVFSSELKGIRCTAAKRFDIDYEALNFYFALGYIPGAMSILKGVQKLPPAHAALYDVKEGKLKTWRYWDVPLPEDGNDKYGVDELLDELEYLLEDSVKLRLTSDVPLGIFLSGGIDSSLVTAMAARCSSTPVKTFTISFPDAGKYDEAAYARIVADHFKTDHHILCGTKNIFDGYKNISFFIDEPIADSSLLPTYLVSKLTREYVTVALGGDGGDELFGGYNHYRWALRHKYLLRYIPRSFLQILSAIAGCLPAGVKGRNKLWSLKGGYLEGHIWGNPYFDSNLRKKLFNRKVLKEINSHLNDPEKWKLNLLSKGCNNIDKLTRLDFLSYLPEDIMTKVDRASMACSLEVRAPWLDYRIIEFAFKKVPASLKVNSRETRILQKHLAARLLPKELNVNRKQGFSLPLDNWLRSDEGQGWCRAQAAHDNRLFNRKFVESLMNGEIKGRMNGARLWALGMFGLRF